MGYAVWMSFQKWDFLTTPHYVGLGNYHKALFLRDPLFWKCLGNTIYYACVSVPLRILVALGLAVLLNQQVKGIALFRTIFYLSSFVAWCATAMLWNCLPLNPETGGINFLLRRLGCATPRSRLRANSGRCRALSS